MSAIAGLLCLDGSSADEASLWRMVESMAHRGPDGRAVWCQGPVGLGHGMLHTTEESLHEVLPFRDEAADLSITAHARVDNRAELIAELGVAPRTPAVTDSELILLAYKHWGKACLDHLVGDFAFAIWDGRTQTLFGACDQFGTRPFYYHVRERELFAFGTEIKALLTVPSVPKRINEVRVADYLALNEEDATSTLYEGISVLPGAHAFEVQGGELRVWKYYTLQPAEGIEGWTVEAYEERFRELFTEAVRCRLRSAFPIGSHLSGGLDSSAVTCVAREALAEAERPRLHTLSLVFDDVTGCDERPYINAVLEQGPVEAHFVPGDAHGPLSNIEEVYDLLDDRLVGGNQRTIWALLETAREAGLRVVLDGYDGDTTVGHGYRHLFVLAQRGEWDRFAQEVAKLVARFGDTEQAQPFERSVASITKAFNAYGVPVIKEQAERGQGIRFVQSVLAARRLFGVRPRDLLRRYWRTLITPYALLAREVDDQRGGLFTREGEQLVRADLAARIGLEERLNESRRTSSRYVRDMLVGERESQREIISSPRRHASLSLMNHVAAMFGVEVRQPFMDRRLIEFCLALPPEMSLRNGWTRYVLRSALRGVLPDLVRERVGKADMTENFSRGLLERDADLLERRLLNLGVLAHFVDQDRVAYLYEKATSAEAEEWSVERTFLARTAVLSTLLNKRFGEADFEGQQGPASAGATAQRRS